MKASVLLPCLTTGLLWAHSLIAADLFTDPAPPALTVTNAGTGTKRVTFGPYPSADLFQMQTKDALSGIWTPDLSGSFSNLTWTAPLGSGNAFHRLEVTSLTSNAVLTATVLNRLAYGPTPALLDRLAVTGPDVYITEQLAPESIVDRATSAHSTIGSIESRFGTPTNYIVSSAQIVNGPGTAGVTELQAWLALRAVFGDRQLLEVLTQFWENHFVTYAGKSANFFIGANFRDATPQRASAEWEWREVTGWRNLMMNPTGTFQDMLKTSAESPAMITYLDTATSRGNPPNIPNENYSRELMELFCQGVDNGYDQSDITNMAPCWTGWTIDLILPGNVGNPFALRTTVRLDPSGPNAFTNLLGVWAMTFRQQFHATSAKRIWGGKTVPARFGSPYTTKLYGNNTVPGLYELNIPARTGTNGIQDGYDIIRHIADLPFTQEFISVKLCRLFVHDGFNIGYDYTSPDLSEEGRLVKSCLQAWESGNPKGQLRTVLATIFNSALFRGQGGNAHKIKTPLEYAASAIRALRQSTDGSGNQGTWTAYTDGAGLVNSQGGGQRGGIGSALNRMGGMQLFNREEPDGYPEAGRGWVAAGSLTERLRFISSLLKPAGDPTKNDANALLNNNVTLPVQLLQLRLPSSTDQRDPGKVTEVFLRLLFPGEGQASLDEYRRIAIDFLNTNDSGTGSSAFGNLTPSSTAGSAYDSRVRGMVAVLMSLQRFHEQ